MSCTFYSADCLQKLKTLPTESIDLLYFNPPYGITQQPWDEALDWKQIFPECFRLLKSTGMLVIHCSVPFSYRLIRDAPKPPTYSWYWNKKHPTTPLLAKVQPLRQVEEVLVWRKQKNTYYPQRVGSEPRIFKSCGITKYCNPVKAETQVYKEVKGFYQTHYIECDKLYRNLATRPESMIELFIKSYTKEGDTILDPTCHTGISGRVAKRLGRNWIGIDKYYYPTELF
jgi:DNA modification methylase